MHIYVIYIQYVAFIIHMNYEVFCVNKYGLSKLGSRSHSSQSCSQQRAPAIRSSGLWKVSEIRPGRQAGQSTLIQLVSARIAEINTQHVELAVQMSAFHAGPLGHLADFAATELQLLFQIGALETLACLPERQ